VRRDLGVQPYQLRLDRAPASTGPSRLPLRYCRVRNRFAHDHPVGLTMTAAGSPDIARVIDAGSFVPDHKHMSVLGRFWADPSIEVCSPYPGIRTVQ
jgi:hypothetical protein